MLKASHPQNERYRRAQAQKRYRCCQKLIEDEQKEQISLLERRIMELTAHHGSLMARNKILERQADLADALAKRHLSQEQVTV